jgi:hypothetical protein
VVVEMIDELAGLVEFHMVTFHCENKDCNHMWEAPEFIHTEEYRCPKCGHGGKEHE